MQPADDAKALEANAKPEGDNPSETGIRISRVWLVQSSFVDCGHASLLAGEPLADAGETVMISPAANVWFSDDRAAIVQLGVRVSPVATETFEAEAVYAAHYAIVGDSPVLSMSEFAWSNGLANLVPFVRAKLAQLTAESRFPTFYLQPMNLAALKQDASDQETVAEP